MNRLVTWFIYLRFLRWRRMNLHHASNMACRFSSLCQVRVRMVQETCQNVLIRRKKLALFDFESQSDH
jgi:hypothetical protein